MDKQRFVFNLQHHADEPPAVPPTPPTEPTATPPAPPAEPPATPPTPPAEPPAKPAGPPEEYADFKVPEGMTFDRESAADFFETAKKLNLTQEQAQELVDLYGSRMASMQAKQQEQVHGWLKESEKRYKAEEINLAKNTLNRFAGDSFKEFLNETGFNVHPEMIALFVHIGEQISEGKFIDPGKVTKPKSLGEALYPNMK